MEKEVKDFIEFVDKNIDQKNTCIQFDKYSHDGYLLEGTKNGCLVLASEILKAGYLQTQKLENDIYRLEVNWSIYNENEVILGYRLLKKEPQEVKLNNKLVDPESIPELIKNRLLLGGCIFIFLVLLISTFIGMWFIIELALGLD